jgi:queuine tRNA-ribosyltransferase
MHGLGVGHPQSIVECVRLGYETFDSALPTRDARTGRLYRFKNDPADPGFEFTDGWFRTLYIDDDKHIKSDAPVSPGCDCLCCRRYSIGYLRHLHKCSDTLFYRLATLHNLRFMVQLMDLLRTATHAQS